MTDATEQSRSGWWPVLADVSKAAGCTVRVYADSALVEFPHDKWDDDCDQFFSEAELRALAAELIWAADRLAARS